MPPRGKRARTDPEAGLAALRALRALPDGPDLRDGLVRALADPSSVVVAAAAELAAERGVESLRPALLGAWERLRVDPVTADPGCLGKTACATALDRLDHADPEPFRAGAAYVQIQPAWPKSEDMAGGLRARCVLALARFGGIDALLEIARALTDPLVEVRAAAAQALRGTGEPAAAALALLKLGAGDLEATVLADALGSLLALCPDEGLAAARRLLEAGPAELIELATLALGQSRLPAALPILAERLALAFRPVDRRVVVVALGLLRTDAARDLLLERVRTLPPADAREAIAALATHSQSPAMRQAVEQAAAGRGLQRSIADAFG